LPTDNGITRFAPEKKPANIRRSMGDLRLKIEAASEPTLRTKKRQRFVPAGQSTQMIVGADGANDATILATSGRLYSSYGLKRVYYSAFSPIPDSSKNLPLIKPPLMREHRLYQADWLYRFYGFGIDEITANQAGGMLDLTLDPKLAWALANRAEFPVDINKAERERLLRVPGLGTKTVKAIVSARRFRRLRLDDLQRLGISIKKVQSFISAEGWSPRRLIERPDLRAMFEPQPEQLSLL
jgi:predicted DNA-binding helix-hairpin-helix protein